MEIQSFIFLPWDLPRKGTVSWYYSKGVILRFNVNFYSSFLNALSDFYESKIKDLLNTKKDDLPIRQDQQQNIIIPNLTEVQYYLDFSVNDDIEY